MRKKCILLILILCVLMGASACNAEGNNPNLPSTGSQEDLFMEAWLLNDGKQPGDTIAPMTGSGTAGETHWGIWLNSETFGKVLDFSVEGAYARIKSTKVDLSGDFTVSCWIKAPVRNVRDRVILAYGRENTMKLYLNHKDNDSLTLELDGMRIEGSGAGLADGLWHHVAVSRQGKKITYYVDGGEVKSCEAEGALLQTRNSDIYIGADCDKDNSFDGSIAEVKIAGKACTPSEMTSTALNPSDNLPKQPRLELKRGVVIDRPQYAGTLIPQSYTEKQDLINCMNMGFDHIKLQLVPEWMIGEEGAFLEENMRYIDSVVEMVQELNYRAIVCVSPCASGIDYNFKTRYLGDLENFEYLCNWYEGLANHALRKGWDADHIAIQLMTEPYDDSSSVNWSWMSDRMYGAVRNILPDTTIITSANRSGNLEYLKKMSPATDDNLIYSFTTYEPYAVGWSSAYTSQVGNETFWNYIGDVPYPIEEGVDYSAEVEAALANVPERFLAEARSALDAYIRGQCDGGSMYWMNYYDSLYNRNWHFLRAQSLDQWSQDNGGNIHIMVVEFGCYDSLYSMVRFGSVGAGIPDSKRLMFIKDMREAWEAYNIGWCYWSYNEGFTVFTTDYHVNHVGGSPTAEEAATFADYALLRDALGLDPHMGYPEDAITAGAVGAWTLRGETALENRIPASADAELSNVELTSDGAVFRGNGNGVARNFAANANGSLTLSLWTKAETDGTLLSAGQEWVSGLHGKRYINDFDSYHQIWGTNIRPSTDDPVQGTACLLGKSEQREDIVFTFQPALRDLHSYLSSDNGAVHLSVFVSDPTMISGGQLEMTSSTGPNDSNEIAWNIPAAELKKGWNHLTFRASDAISNNTDLGDIRCCRIYLQATGKAVVMLDDMYLDFDHRDASLESWRLAIENGRIAFHIGEAQALGNTNVLDGQWHHILIQIDGGKISAYLDGALQTEIQEDGLQPRWEMTDLVFGADTAGENGFSGILRNVSIYNRIVDSTAVWEEQE